MLTLDKRSGHARLYIMQPGGNDMDYSVSLHDSYLITTLTFTEYFGLAGHDKASQISLSVRLLLEV